MSPSTATPERLPDIETLRRLTKSIAMLDAILCREWENRYYSYDSKWGPGEEMASMQNGSGDDWFVLFDRQGAALKGFAHEYPHARSTSFAARIQQNVPAVFESFLKEPAFGMDVASFCLWRRHGDPTWSVVTPARGRVSPDKDGSEGLLYILDGKPQTYRDWAEEYHERPIPLDAVRAFYEHQPLTANLIAALNPELALSDIMLEMVEIGYPSS